MKKSYVPIIALAVLVASAVAVSVKDLRSPDTYNTPYETETTSMPIEHSTLRSEFEPETAFYTESEIAETESVSIEDTAEICETEEPIETFIETEEVYESEPIDTTPVYDYTEEELDLLARLIYSEGGIESYNTQLMIGSVVMNRVDSDLFPNTIREVIYQENQFSVTFIEIDGITMIDRPADEEAKKAAYEILTYGSILPHKVQVFYLSNIEDCWVNTREIYSVSDNTIFAYIYERGAKE